MQQY